jgi:hypothetical protein
MVPDVLVLVVGNLFRRRGPVICSRRVHNRRLHNNRYLRRALVPDVLLVLVVGYLFRRRGPVVVGYLFRRRGPVVCSRRLHNNGPMPHNIPPPRENRLETMPVRRNR